MTTTFFSNNDNDNNDNNNNNNNVELRFGRKGRRVGMERDKERFTRGGGAREVGATFHPRSSELYRAP